MVVHCEHRQGRAHGLVIFILSNQGVGIGVLARNCSGLWEEGRTQRQFKGPHSKGDYSLVEELRTIRFLSIKCSTPSLVSQLAVSTL